MELTLYKPQDNICKITVLISADEVNKSVKAVSKETGGNNTKDIPDVSPEILEKIQANFVNAAIEEAIQKFKLQPISRILCDGGTLSNNSQLEFFLHLEVLPKISLPKNLESLSIEVKEPLFENKAYQHSMQRLRRTQRTINEVTENRLPQDGDIVFLELNGSYEGSPVLGMENNKMQLALASQYQEHQEFADVARLLYVGTNGTTELSLPADYPNSSLRGKMINMNIKLIKIVEEILPEMTETFVKSLGFSDMNQMQKFISQDVLNRKITECQQEAEEKLLVKLIDFLDFPLPESLLMIHRKEYRVQARNYYSQLGLAGDQLEQKLEACQLENEEMAQKQTRRQCYLMAVGYSEKLNVTEADIEGEIKKLAEQSGHDAKALQEQIYNSPAIYELQDRMLAEKAMRTLYTKAKKIMVDSKGVPVKKPTQKEPIQ